MNNIVVPVLRSVHDVPDGWKWREVQGLLSDPARVAFARYYQAIATWRANGSILAPWEVILPISAEIGTGFVATFREFKAAFVPLLVPGAIYRLVNGICCIPRPHSNSCGSFLRRDDAPYLPQDIGGLPFHILFRTDQLDSKNLADHIPHGTWDSIVCSYMPVWICSDAPLPTKPTPEIT